MSTLIDRFEWSGGHPALDFVNTLDDRPFERPVETLETYQDLVLFTELAGLIEPAVAQRLRARAGPSCLRIVTRARALREHLFAILTAVHAGEPASRPIAGCVRPRSKRRCMLARWRSKTFW